MSEGAPLNDELGKSTCDGMTIDFDDGAILG
jgi:hypothetical protein